MAGKPQTLSEGQKKEVVRLFWKKLLTSMLIFFAILGGITGWSLWEIKQRVEAKMEELVAKQFEEPQIQEVVRQVAAERASFLMTDQIMPDVNSFKIEVASVSNGLKGKMSQIEVFISDANIALDEVRSISDFSLLVTKASSDDRASFDALRKIADTGNHKFQEIANQSLNQIVVDLAVTERYEYDIKWKEYFNLDPAKASLAEFDDLLNNTNPAYHSTMLKTIWKQQRFPKVKRLDMLYRVIDTTQSIGTLHRACLLMNVEAKLGNNIRLYEVYLKWWEENREKYNKSPENQPTDSND